MRRVTGAEYNFVRFLMAINVWWIGAKAYRHPFKSINVVGKILRNYKNIFHGKMFVRAFKIDKKYVLHCYHPAWPSKAFNSFFINRLHEIEPISKNHTSLRRLFVAITKRCPLQCEHCSESETLYQQDMLSCQELKDKIESFVKRGASQLLYSGGEPLSRFNDLETLVSHFRKDCDQWMYTSGFGLTLHKAKALKRAGLRGAAISLDHHLEEHHNNFRGNSKSYFWVLEAIKNCNAVGILTALNICPTKDYVTSFDFEDYVKLAKELHVPIINIIEPRSVGNYRGKNVELGIEHKDLLLRLSNKYNFNRSLVDFPTVFYPAAFGRSLPCGGGRTSLFLDFDGTLYPCPFCKTRVSGVSVKEKVCLVQ